jgi:2-keto-4-pentenoate hydratase/2-oxohepta-3-ene-1,7-dioic acid hydratase in catechol pathway
LTDLTEAGRQGALSIDPAWSLLDVLRSDAGLGGLVERVHAVGPSILEPFALDDSDVRVLAPVSHPEKVIGIGLNYHDHAEETGMAKPSEPFLFAMYPNAVIGPGETVVIPSITDQIDYEAELAVVIGKTVRNIGVDEALAAVAGYTIVNDISARDLQFKDSQWIRGKSYDTFLPTGPGIVPVSELGAADNLGIRLRLNGKTMQESNTANLIFGVSELVSYLSGIMTLRPGDIIATGTPGGVGFTRKPPVFLKAGDRVEVEVEGIGILRNPVGHA